ncbi:hypothetical protein EC957_008669, partial [Mortierella hygrophila]
MSALLDTLTFNALQKKSIPSRHCANHEFFDHVTSKWHIPEEGTFSTIGTCSGIDNCVYLKTSKDDSSPDRLVFDGNRDSFQYDRTLFRDLGSPLCLYRLGCTFPSAVHIEQTDKSSWWLALIHRATGKLYGIDDIKGRVALRIRYEEVILSQYIPEGGDRRKVWRATEQQSYKDVKWAYLETLSQEMIDRLSTPETEDAALLEELSNFVEDNRVFKGDMLGLLSYLASDKCANGYDDLVAG